MDSLNTLILDNLVLIAVVILGGALIIGVTLRIRNWLKDL